ncbi:MAG: hypothetical protein QW667_06070 [Candidatus Bathyarchaeia archaeon]
MKRPSTRSVALCAVFAALHVILYVMSFGLWRNWGIYLEPIEGIILGPWAGFSAAFIGSMIGRAIKPIDVWMFGIIAEPMGVWAAGFLARGKWKPVIMVYVTMLLAYFIHPFGTWLPIWTVLDIVAAFAFVYPAAKLSENLFEKNSRLLPVSLIVISFVATVTDALTRVFLLIPIGLYKLFSWSPATVYDIFILGAIDSYIEDALVVAVSFFVGVPLLLALNKVISQK